MKKWTTINLSPQLLMGSQYFFSCYEDFIPHDLDEIQLVYSDEGFKVRHFMGQNRCLFQVNKQQNVDDYINDALKTDTGMVVGKFLVPEFNKLINFTIADLPKVQPLIDILDEKHQYEKIIYDAYLENGDFILTDEQRLQAYNSYKQSRNIK